MDNLVRWCRKYDVYVIIDMHGAPGGQTGANIDDSPKDQPELFSDKANQDRLVDLWVKLADRYKDDPMWPAMTCSTSLAAAHRRRGQVQGPGRAALQTDHPGDPRRTSGT